MKRVPRLRRDAIQAPRAEHEGPRRVRETARPGFAAGREQPGIEALERQPEGPAEGVGRLARGEVNGVKGGEGEVQASELESREPRVSWVQRRDAAKTEALAQRHSREIAD
jgi:hypothetical protein